MPKITKIQGNIVTIEGDEQYTQGAYYKLSPDADGVVISATETQANLLIIGDPSKVVSNKTVKLTDNKLEVIESKVGHFGSIISPLGNIVFPEGKKLGKIFGKSLLDNNPPELLDRVGLSESLETGIFSIDTMIPIGRGQRELIIGDRNTGKTSIAISTIINQVKTDVKTVYVSVGQKRSSVINTYNTLKENDAMKKTIIVFANPDSAAEQFYAPSVGMALAESIAYKGHDVLLVVDDLSKHANVYREVSLSVGKNPGREAYPTDIFYQHARLLERAGRFNGTYKNGSITCLPIVETVQEDIASLIPSNVISITDGQIFTNSELFNNGEYPAINIGLSVSRTGSAVQNEVLKNTSKGLKSKYSELHSIKKFADMSIDISDEIKEKVGEWNAMNNMLIQYGFLGYSKEQILILSELFYMGYLGEIIDKKTFSVKFNYFCDNYEGPIKTIESIKNGDYTRGDKKFRYALLVVFVPLIKVASGQNNSMISSEEFENMKRGN